MEKTITARTKLYKSNADTIGWHVHTSGGHEYHAGEYIGYNQEETMDEIVKLYSLGGLRLTYIGGNILVFTP